MKKGEFFIRDIVSKKVKASHARISEIFLSYQGEGSFTGSRQLFVRFYGCNLACIYCDTILDGYKVFSPEKLLNEVSSRGREYNEFTLTGGEPLLHADFLKVFLPLYKKKFNNKRIYLETNGTLSYELDMIIDYIDIIAMDFKLPCSGLSGGNIGKEHWRFIEKAVSKDLIVKAVITSDTGMDAIKKMTDVLKSVRGNFIIILQPVTPVNSLAEKPDTEMLSYFERYIFKETGKPTRIMGQAHKYLGIK
ncbi:MAG: 7-carboxy-7-deazaguanine synthase QueE [Candidatus Omnitrophota bacterium]